MKKIFQFFAAGKDRSLIEDRAQIDRLYKKYRIRIKVIYYWIGSSIISMILAVTLWKVKVSE